MVVLLSALLTLGFGAVAGAKATAHVVRGGTLTVAQVGASYPGFDPQGPSNVASVPMYYAIFDPLFYPNVSTGGVYPGLALSYNTSGGGRTLTFVLRRGVRFSDGTPWNAQAMVFNIQRSWSATQNSECIADMTSFQSVRATGKYTVVMHFGRPEPGYISLISDNQCGDMVSPAAVQAEGSQFGLKPVGTGPFVQTSWSPGVSWTGIANLHYWQKGYPLLHELQFLSFGTTQAADACMISGQCQLEETTTAAEMSQYYSNRTVKFVKIPDMESVYPTWLQIGTAPFNNYDARLAIAEATNQRAIIAALYTASNGVAYATPSTGPIAPGSWAYTPNPGYPKYDPAAATKLVSSIPGGLSFTLNCIAIPVLQALCAALQSQWQSVGMHVTINTQAGSTIVTDNHMHNFQATSLVANTTSPPVDPDLILARNFFSTSPLNQTQVRSNQLDKWLLKAESVFSQPVRRAAYQQFDAAFDKVLPWAMEFNEVYYAMVGHTFHGVSVPWNSKGTFSQETYVPWYSYWVS